MAPEDMSELDPDQREATERPEAIGSRRRRPVSRGTKVVLGVLLAILLVLGGSAYWLVRQIDPGGSGAKVTVLVPPGSNGSSIASLLHGKGVVGNTTIFRFYMRVTGAGPFLSGKYELRKHMSMGDAVNALEAGPKVRFEKLTIPEGLRLAQIAERVGRLKNKSAQRFLEVAASGQIRSRYQPPGVPMEGVLFPDTYLVSEDEDEAAILRRMVDRFDQIADAVPVTQAGQIGLTPYQAVVVASLVEAEAKVPEDRPLIAAVIRNRLQAGMPLQIDATVLYALGVRKERVLDSDLRVSSPYNTYLHTGLPPSPIDSPGESSLRAAVNPAAVPYLYYVLTDKSGKHAFATTSREFEALVADARRRGVF